MSEYVDPRHDDGSGAGSGDGVSPAGAVPSAGHDDDDGLHNPAGPVGVNADGGVEDGLRGPVDADDTVGTGPGDMCPVDVGPVDADPGGVVWDVGWDVGWDEGEWDDEGPVDGWVDDPSAEGPVVVDGWSVVEEELASIAAADALEGAVQDRELAELDAASVVDRLGGTRTRVNRVLVDQLRLVGQWADLHSHLDQAVAPGAQRLVTVGGDATPTVAEFAIAELGVALHVSTGSAARLIGDVLDLRHRLPGLWQATLTGQVPVATARRVAEETRGLTAAAAVAVDRRIARLAGGLTWRRLATIVRAAGLAADPDQGHADATSAEADAGVWVDDESQLVGGYGKLIARASAGDLAAFNHAVAVVARALGVLGDPDTLQQRRAKALGILAHPQLALDLVERANTIRQQHTPPTRRHDGGRRREGAETAQSAAPEAQAGTEPPAGTGTASRPEPAAAAEYAAAEYAAESEANAERESAANAKSDAATGADPGAPAERLGDNGRNLDFRHVLYFHLSREAVDAMLAGGRGGVGRLEGVGPVIGEQIRRWLSHSSVIVKPVIDPDTMPAVDCWEVPPRISEAVRLRRPADYFPWSTCTSRHQDNEHPVPYLPPDRGGPPGQTAVHTLAKITRFHHRVKTFGGWTVTPVRTDTWLWRAPTGHYSLVDPTGTTNLGRLS